MKAMFVSLAALTLPCMLACGGSTFACDLRPDENRCQERQSANPITAGIGSTFCDALATAGVSGIDGPCPGSPVGGCRTQAVAETITDWYYPSDAALDPDTEAEIKAECDKDGASYVSP